MGYNPPRSIPHLPPKHEAAQPVRLCSYCGRPARPDWLYCGEGQVWGCGAPLEKAGTIQATQVGITAKEATEAMRAAADTITTNVSITRPGMTAREFERGFRLSSEYKASYAGQIEQLGNAVEDLKVELGRAFLPLFKPLLKLFPVGGIA